MRAVYTASGEPAGVQICAYLCADWRARSGSTTPCSSGSHSHRGSGTTRGSERNSARYSRTAGAVGAAGAPRLTSRMLLLMLRKRAREKLRRDVDGPDGADGGPARRGGG